MPSSQMTGQQQIDSVKSRLGQSLLRLYRSLPQNRDHQDHVDSVFALWQSRWTEHRDQIAHRLSLIEAQLEKLDTQAESPLRLALIGVPSDAKEMTPKDSPV